MSTYLKTAVNNGWISRKLFSIMTTLDLIFDQAGIVEIESDLDAILNVDEITIDPISLPNRLIAVYKKYILEYLTQQGFLVDRGVLSETILPDLEEIVLAVYELNNVPMDLLTLLDNLLNSNIGVTNIELLYNLLSIVNPDVKFNLFFNLIEKVSVTYLEKLKIKVNNILVENSTDENVTPADIASDDEIKATDNFTIMKNILDVLGKDTPEPLVNMLIYETFIIFYHKFGDQEIKTIYKAFLLDQVNLDNTSIKNLVLETLPISLAYDTDKELYTENIVNFLKTSFGNFDQDYLSKTIDELYDLLVNKSKFNSFIQNAIQKIQKVKQ